MTRKDELAHLFDAAVSHAEDEAIARDGEIPSEAYEAVMRLAKIKELRRSLSPLPRKNRWVAPCILAVTLVIVSVLLFARVSDTQIVMTTELRELDIRLSDLEMAESNAFFERLSTQSLGIFGAENIKFRRLNWPPGGFNPSDNLSVELAATQIAGCDRAGRINLSNVILPPKTRVAVHPAGTALNTGQNTGHNYAVTIEPPPGGAQLAASLTGALQMSAPGIADMEKCLTRPTGSQIEIGDAPLVLDAAVMDPDQIVVSTPLAIKGISFERSRNGHAISTVLAGKIYFESLAGKSIDLRRGQELRLTEFDGHIRTLNFTPNSVIVELEGRVSGMSTGGSAAPRDLMPTWLAWLRAQHGLSLLWGTALYFFGLVMMALRWFKFSV